MIHLIMAELKRNPQALSLTDLSQRLQLDHSVVEGMVATMVRRGYLLEVRTNEPEGPCACGCATCPRRVATEPATTYRLVEHTWEGSHL
ncbi:MAG: helix-turn-helix domain-containing protein [Chloroflexaceae bacterium]|nr:helix-turn-helix domain-containing protein [Chloroflexaceae bacterium]